VGRYVCPGAWAKARTGVGWPNSRGEDARAYQIRGLGTEGPVYGFLNCYKIYDDNSNAAVEQAIFTNIFLSII